MSPAAPAPLSAEPFLSVPSAGIGPRSPPHNAIQLQQARQPPPPDQNVVGRGHGEGFGGVAGDRAGDRLAGQKSSPPMGTSMVAQGLLRVWYSPELSSFFLIIKRGYFDGVDEEKEDELETLLVLLPVGSRPRCAMDVVPPGIFSGTSRAIECWGKALRVPVPENPVHPMSA